MKAVVYYKMNEGGRKTVFELQNVRNTTVSRGKMSGHTEPPHPAISGYWEGEGCMERAGIT
jgi:hypothetical protein